MECVVCEEEVDQRLQLDGVVVHVIVAGEPRPVHAHCCGVFGSVRTEEAEK